MGARGVGAGIVLVSGHRRGRHETKVDQGSRVLHP